MFFFLFFLQFGTSYPLYRYEIVHITIQKENGKRKAFILHKEVGLERGLVLLFSFFSSIFHFFLFFRQGGNKG